MTLAENCADLAKLLPVAAALITEPDEDGTTGTSQPGTRPPWNSAAATALMDAHEGIRRLEASIRRDVTGHPGPRRGPSHANTLAALAAIERLSSAVTTFESDHAARITEHWIRQIRELPAIDETEPWIRVRGAVCPYCGMAMLRLRPRAGRVTCLRLGACRDSEGRHPEGLVQQSMTGKPVIAWSDGYIQYADEEAMNSDLVRQVRELHAPRWYDGYHRSGQVWLVCHGCDEGAHAEDRPPWPCSTAMIVYTEQEIAAREPQIAECTQDHGLRGDGQPIRPQAVFLLRDGQLLAARWNCDHVAPVPAESSDPW